MRERVSLRIPEGLLRAIKRLQAANKSSFTDTTIRLIRVGLAHENEVTRHSKTLGEIADDQTFWDGKLASMADDWGVNLDDDLPPIPLPGKNISEAEILAMIDLTKG